MKDRELEQERIIREQAKYSSKDLDTLTFDSNGVPLKLQLQNPDKLSTIQISNIPFIEREGEKALKGLDKHMYMTQKTNWFKAEDEKLMKQIKDKVMKGQTTDWDKIDEIFLKEKKEL